ncbi:MAG TPA: LamG-like jellyroll fold domain-containing protein [Candidatus Udaeobacter sp.]|nr:LamG-like jellyroll fold domain-containing protein [Candidatus Udaeobacter sp.]
MQKLRNGFSLGHVGQFVIALMLLVLPLGALSSCAVNGSQTDTATQAVTATLPPALAAYEFGEGSGRLVADSSCNGHNGVINGARWVTPSPFTTPDLDFGFALNFRTGRKDSVEIDNFGLNGATQATWSAWVLPVFNPPGGQHGHIISKSGSFNLKTSTAVGGDPTQPHFACELLLDNGGSIQQNSVSFRHLGEMVHVACVYNGELGVLDIYVNGQKDNGVLTGTTTDIPTQLRSSCTPTNVGRADEGYEFWGVIDNVRLYLYDLALEQVQLDMLTPVGPPDCTVTTN